MIRHFSIIKILYKNYCILKLSTLLTILKYKKVSFLGDVMRNKNNKHLGIEIDPELHHKLLYISKYEGRSVNGQILYLVRKCVKEFEKNEGDVL